ncbi:MAG: hypothetical protein ACREO8_12480 [Luteimonas sp.]
MSMINRFFATLIALSLLLGCASGRANDSLSNRVSRLVDETTKSARSQEKALTELGKLGQPAVPYLVGHLGDMRPLARSEISLTNSASNSFEGLRHYSPDTVHDALAAILNQITGKSFEFVYNGATPEEREKNRHNWIDWCKSAYPNEAEECSGKP